MYTYLHVKFLNYYYYYDDDDNDDDDVEDEDDNDEMMIMMMMIWTSRQQMCPFYVSGIRKTQKKLARITYGLHERNQHFDRVTFYQSPELVSGSTELRHFRNELTLG